MHICSWKDLDEYLDEIWQHFVNDFLLFDPLSMSFRCLLCTTSIGHQRIYCATRIRTRTRTKLRPSQWRSVTQIYMYSILFPMCMWTQMKEIWSLHMRNIAVKQFLPRWCVLKCVFAYGTLRYCECSLFRCRPAIRLSIYHTGDFSTSFDILESKTHHGVKNLTQK